MSSHSQQQYRPLPSSSKLENVQDVALTPFPDLMALLGNPHHNTPSFHHPAYLGDIPTLSAPSTSNLLHHRTQHFNPGSTSHTFNNVSHFDKSSSLGAMNHNTTWTTPHHLTSFSPDGLSGQQTSFPQSSNNTPFYNASLTDGDAFNYNYSTQDLFDSIPRPHPHALPVPTSSFSLPFDSGLTAPPDNSYHNFPWSKSFNDDAFLTYCNVSNSGYGTNNITNGIPQYDPYQSSLSVGMPYYDNGHSNSDLTTQNDFSYTSSIFQTLLPSQHGGNAPVRSEDVFYPNTIASEASYPSVDPSQHLSTTNLIPKTVKNAYTNASLTSMPPASGALSVDPVIRNYNHNLSTLPPATSTQINYPTFYNIPGDSRTPELRSVGLNLTRAPVQSQPQPTYSSPSSPCLPTCSSPSSPCLSSSSSSPCSPTSSSSTLPSTSSGIPYSKEVFKLGGQLCPSFDLWDETDDGRFRCLYKGPTHPEGCYSVLRTIRNLSRHMKEVHARREAEMDLENHEKVAHHGLPKDLLLSHATCPLDEAGLLKCKYYQENAKRWEVATMDREYDVIMRHALSDHDGERPVFKQGRKLKTRSTSLIAKKKAKTKPRGAVLVVEKSRKAKTKYRLAKEKN